MQDVSLPPPMLKPSQMVNPRSPVNKFIVLLPELLLAKTIAG